MFKLSFVIVSTSLLSPSVAMAYETSQATAGGTIVTIAPKDGEPKNNAETTSLSDCSGNKITIVNTGTRVATGGGTAGGVTINGRSITIDGKTETCSSDR